MSEHDELIKYFIQQTNKRFDEIEKRFDRFEENLEKKLDPIIKLRWMMVGGAAAVSIIVTLVAEIFRH